MATVVSFHAHPDDESIHVGGTLAKLSAAGHRTVLVFATKGEHGEVADGFLGTEEQLWQRREQETQRSAEILGVQRVEFLGYHDSGMIGTPENDLPDAFWQARSTRPPSGWPRSSARRTPTSSPPTTPTAPTATPTTSRCTGSACAPRSWPAPRGSSRRP